MVVSDFILQTRDDLQEKKEQWSDESLLLKLKRAYVDMQFDLPFFIATQKLDIKKEQTEYYIENTFLKDISMQIEGRRYRYTDMENLYTSENPHTYSYHAGALHLAKEPVIDGEGKVAYKYEKNIKTDKCHIEIPANYMKALEYIFKAYIYEKPKGNSKERNLNKHYLALYQGKIKELSNRQKARAKNVQYQYQLI